MRTGRKAGHPEEARSPESAQGAEERDPAAESHGKGLVGL